MGDERKLGMYFHGQTVLMLTYIYIYIYIHKRVIHLSLTTEVPLSTKIGFQLVK